MAAKWSVRKREGVWQAMDSVGKLRYAALDWGAVVSFALMGYFEETEAQRVTRIIRDWPRRGPLWGDL
ncbi:MAG: hypothetical protein ABFE07_12165 [Armatimonadia bacterium]